MADVVVRPARAEDRDDVLAFCTNTWEWGDYIDKVWEQWLNASNGTLLVALVDDRPVGVMNMQMVSKEEAWLEGIRVDPAYRRNGVGQAMCLEALAEAMRRGATLARLTTTFDNEGSIGLAKRNHMRQVGAFRTYTANLSDVKEKISAVQESAELATRADLDDIIAYLNASNIFPQVGGLYYVHFAARTITAELLEEKIAAGQIYLLRRWDRLDGLAIAEPLEEHGRKRLSVGYIDGTTTDAISLTAYDLRRRGQEQSLEQVRIYAPDLVLVSDALQGLDYTSDSPLFYTFERGLT